MQTTARFHFANRNGQALIYAMISVLVLGAIGAGTISLLGRDRARNAQEAKIGTRSGLSAAINGYLSSVSVLNASLFDPACVAEQIKLPSPNLVEVTSPCVIKTGALGLDGFRELPLRSAFNRDQLLTGTLTAPVFYNFKGEICPTPSEDCAFEVYTYFAAADFIENGIRRGAVQIRYKIKNQSKVKLDKDLLKTIDFEGSVTVPLERFNRRNNSSVEACKTPTGVLDVSKAGQVVFGVKKNPSWLNAEEAVCVEALGTRFCPPGLFLIGMTAEGSPLCAGERAPCPEGTVQMGYTSAGVGGVRPWCVSANCSNRAGRFGFSNPSAGDNLATTGHGCRLITTPSTCADKAKTTISSSGSLGCVL